MRKQSTIVVTGAAGFIGSCMVQYLNENGFTNLVLVDEFVISAKQVNWQHTQFKEKVERNALEQWLAAQQEPIACIVHLGARTDTTEFDYSVHDELNVKYSQMIWRYCAANNVPLIYASSAATYGAGELGYNDDHNITEQLQPLNPYGVSKNEFDKWALKQNEQPPCWTGLKFFNVYGPNEYHKGRMASVIWHSFNQIINTGQVKLFKSHHPDYKDGEQLRDFIYVKDLMKVIYWMMDNMLSGRWGAEKNGLYNLGTGNARSFYDLAKATFAGMDREADIIFIDMPEDIRDKYQYYTQANMRKLHDAGYNDNFYTLEAGVDEYIRKYLSKR